jgi:hypothetical protein
MFFLGHTPMGLGLDINWTQWPTKYDRFNPIVVKQVKCFILLA